MGTLLNLMPPGMLGPDSVNPLNIFNSGATGGFAANSLAGQVINMDGAQVQQYLNQATVSLGSEYFRTAVHMLAPVFKALFTFICCCLLFFFSQPTLSFTDRLCLARPADAPCPPQGLCSSRCQC